MANDNRVPEGFVGVNVPVHPDDLAAKVAAVHEVLEAEYQKITAGYCPYCNEEEYPADADGNEIDDEFEEPTDYHLDHQADCIIIALQEALQATRTK